MQHLDIRTQLAIKQRFLEDQLKQAGLYAQTCFRPILGLTWGYRLRARLSVRHVARKGGVLIGFHERHHNYVADMTTCDVLPSSVSDLLVPLRLLVGRLSIRARLPQIEVAVGDAVTVLVLRVLETMNVADEAQLREFAQRHRVQFWIQPKGPDSAFPLDPGGVTLAYTLPVFQIRMPFRPTDFTQVNHAVNRALVGRAVSLLAPDLNDRILDLFCGLGNFALPLARFAGEVLGIEGNPALVQRATENAALNGLAGRATFAHRNLSEFGCEDVRALPYNKWLIDPPRDGALAISKALVAAAQTRDITLPTRIVYISCHPLTLVRDARLLVHQAGYALCGAGVINMFAHTSHIESIALFER